MDYPATKPGVEWTNDEATRVKASIKSLKYIEDEFIDQFLPPTPVVKERKSPELHRGYYLRVRSVWERVVRFIEAADDGAVIQIVNIGCGFDTLFFRLKSKFSKRRFRFIDIDLEDVVHQKIRLIRKSEKLCGLLSGLEFEDFQLRSDEYASISKNIKDCDGFIAALNGLDRSTPVLFIAECVFVYLPVDVSGNILKSISANFPKASFFLYDAVNLDDRFGELMKKQIGSGLPLLGSDACKSMETQQQRFLNAGFASARVQTMMQVWNNVQEAEKRRILSLEPFVEVEILQQLFEHYVFVEAEMQQ